MCSTVRPSASERTAADADPAEAEFDLNAQRGRVAGEARRSERAAGRAPRSRRRAPPGRPRWRSPCPTRRTPASSRIRNSPAGCRWRRRRSGGRRGRSTVASTVPALRVAADRRRNVFGVDARDRDAARGRVLRDTRRSPTPATMSSRSASRGWRSTSRARLDDRIKQRFHVARRWHCGRPSPPQALRLAQLRRSRTKRSIGKAPKSVGERTMPVPRNWKPHFSMTRRARALVTRFEHHRLLTRPSPKARSISACAASVP